MRQSIRAITRAPKQKRTAELAMRFLQTDFYRVIV